MLDRLRLQLLSELRIPRYGRGVCQGSYYAVALMGDKTADAKLGKGDQMKAYASSKSGAIEAVERGLFEQIQDSKIGVR